MIAAPDAKPGFEAIVTPASLWRNEFTEWLHADRAAQAGAHGDPARHILLMHPSRSNSASAPSTRNTNLPAVFAVSICH
jgi:hypothetical protein